MIFPPHGGIFCDVIIFIVPVPACAGMTKRSMTWVPVSSTGMTKEEYNLGGRESSHGKINKKNRRGGFDQMYDIRLYSMPFRARNIFITISRWSSFANFQYKFINCRDSFFASGSSVPPSQTWDFGRRPLRGSRSI